MPDETATVIVEVRSITARPVRRRGMKPLVEAVVADGSGVMKATFFNQPWLADRYRPGTRLMLRGKYQGAQPLPRQRPRRTEEVGGGAAARAVAQYPATKGISSTQILAAGARAPRRRRRRRRAAAGARCASPSGCPTAPPRSPPRTSATTRAAGAGLAFDELLLDQVVQLRLRAERRAGAAARPALAEPRDAVGALARRAAAVRADRRPARARWTRSTPTSRASGRCSGC